MEGQGGRGPRMPPNPPSTSYHYPRDYHVPSEYAPTEYVTSEYAPSEYAATDYDYAASEYGYPASEYGYTASEYGGSQYGGGYGGGYGGYSSGYGGGYGSGYGSAEYSGAGYSGAGYGAGSGHYGRGYPPPPPGRGNAVGVAGSGLPGRVPGTSAAAQGAHMPEDLPPGVVPPGMYVPTLGGMPYVHPSMQTQGHQQSHGPATAGPGLGAVTQTLGGMQIGMPRASPATKVWVNPYDVRMMSMEQGLERMQSAMQGLELADPKAPEWGVDTYKQVGVRRALRPGFGAAGKLMPLAANHFPMKMTATQAYQYDVFIKPLPSEGDKPRRKIDGPIPQTPPFPQRLGRKILAALGLQNGWPHGWAYDGRKSMFCSRPFLAQDQKHEFVLKLAANTEGARERSFVVTIRYTSTVDLSALKSFVEGTLGAEPPQGALQVLDLVLRNGVSNRETATVIGSHVYFYMPSDREMWSRLGKGLEAWGGYKQSVRACQFGLSLNLDLAATAFVMGNQPLHDLVAEVCGAGTPNQMAAVMASKKELRNLREGLRGIKVVIERGPDKIYKKVIRQVSNEDCKHTLFRYEAEDRDVDVVYYNQVVFGYDVKYPFLPPVNVSADPKRPIWTPMELCKTVPGQRRRLMDDANLTTNMLRFAGIKPENRRPFLERIVGSDSLSGFANDPCTAAFGVEVAPKMIEVKARVLEPPCLAYSHPSCIFPGTKGHWNLINTKFPTAEPLESWAMCSIAACRDVEIEGELGIQGFLDDLVHTLNQCGVTCKCPPRVYGSVKDIRGAMQQAMEAAEAEFDKPCRLICVLLPTNDKDTYREVKQVSDSYLGLPSQVLVANKAGIGKIHKCKGRRQYVANVTLKINAKLGGVNVRLAGDVHVKLMSSLPMGPRPFIVFGADVTHPTGYTEQDPSIAAVTASYDKTLGRYSACILVQKHRQEIITELKQAAKALLVNFYKKNGQKKPEMILFYRDGVSEGQFAEVLKAEYTAIRAACFELEENYCPPITFVVVQKRHGTRFFPDTSGSDKSGNTMPGTVIDRDICHPTQFDFYLNSHAGLQGHNKAAHYHVLVDENGFSADSLQSFTYWYCYLYCRCTRSVSYVPPAYYAHLAAFRGRLMVQYLDESAAIATGAAPTPPPVLPISPNLLGTMHYV